MLQSFHQSTEQLEILFNKTKYDALSAELKRIIDYAVQAASADMSWKAIQRSSQDCIELKKAGVNFHCSVLQACTGSFSRLLGAPASRKFTFEHPSCRILSRDAAPSPVQYLPSR